MSIIIELDIDPKDHVAVNVPIEVDGPFRIYGTQEQLLTLAQQIKDAANKIQIGFVSVYPDDKETLIKNARKWRAQGR